MGRKEGGGGGVGRQLLHLSTRCPSPLLLAFSLPPPPSLSVGVEFVHLGRSRAQSQLPNRYPYN